MKNSKFISTRNMGNLHINTKRTLDQDFQWKVGLIYIKLNSGGYLQHR